jgi:acetyl esterase/lipase
MRRNGSADGAGEMRAWRWGRGDAGSDLGRGREAGRKGGRDRGRRVGSRRIARLRRALAGAAVAAAVLATPVGAVQPRSTAAAADAPTLTVTPAAGLADGGTVRAAGAGLTGWPVLVHCAADPGGIADCDWATVTALELGAGGTFSVDHRVFALIHTEAGGAIDCRVAGRCVLVASSFLSPDPLADGASAAVAFDPAAPLLPTPAITLTPATALRDGQQLRVDGRNFGHRQSPTVQVYQCAPEPSFETCRALTDMGVEPGPDGSFSVEAKVWHVIRADGQEIDCLAAGGSCLLVATTRPWETLDEPWAARAALPFDPDVPPLPGPELAVTPATDLHDVTELAVHGHSFTPGGGVRVSVCDAAALGDCDGATEELPTADAAGAFELRMNAFADFGAGWEEEVPVHCRTSGCVVSAEDLQSRRRVTVPLGFGPPDPLRGRYLDAVFDQVDVVEDVVYRRTVDYRGNPVDLRLDIYRPAGDTATSRPAIVWLHGGWFKGGNGGGGMPEYGAAAARRGYVGVDVGYRVRPDLDVENYPDLYDAMVDAYEDATAAVDWVGAHAGEYGIDPDVIAAGGFSAGAVTTTNLAYMPGQLGPATSGIAAALPLEGWFVRPDDPALPVPGPFAVPDPGEPPAIVFHGTADRLLPFGSATETCPMAAEAGIACEYVGYEGGTHGSVSRRVREVLHRGTRFLVDEVLAPRGYFDVGVDAGGPYEVEEGSTVPLAGSATGDGLSYAWSPRNALDNPAVPAPTFTGRDDGREALTLTATNTHGIAARDTTEVLTVNAAPAIDDVDTRTEEGGRTLAVSATITDPGRADTHRADIDWGDGTVEALAVTQGGGTATAAGSHDYAEPGAYAVTIRVTDDDGGAATWDGSATVGCTVVGTDGDDRLVGTGGDDVICALGGDDVVLARGGNDVVYGGDGDDRLYGQRGNDVVYGGDGDDRLYGQRGRDVLVGGPRRDRAFGGEGRDRCDAEAARSCRRGG